MAHDDGRAWWYVPARTRAFTAPVGVVLLAMGASSLVRGGPTYVLGWLFLVLGLGVAVCSVASRRSDDALADRPVRRTVLLTGGYLLVVVVAVGSNVALAGALYR